MRSFISRLDFVLLILVVVALVLVSSNASAECSGGFCVGKVSRIYTASTDNKVYIGTDGDERNLDCSPVSDVYIVLEPDQALFKELYALLLSAVAAEKGVRLRTNTDGTECRLLYGVFPQ